MNTIIYQIEVSISTPLNETEVGDRVGAAINNVFPAATIREDGGYLVGKTHNVDRFSELIHQRAILDTARNELCEGRFGNTISFRLKKQAAFQGVVNFAVGNPDELGDIEVEIQVTEPDLDAFLDYIAPRTVDGKPIE